MPAKITAKDLLKTNNILKIDSNTTLRKALSKLSRTHDAAFVFSEKSFLGVISPYYAVFKTSYPAQTNVQKALFNPPHLTLNTPIWEIARLMAESKVYFLPVFDKNNEFVGIVSVNRILRRIKSDKELLKKIKVKKRKNVKTIAKESTLDETYSKMRNAGVSRLPVVDKNNHLQGIISRYDIQFILTEPQQKPRRLSREGNKKNSLEEPMFNYATKLVVTDSPKSSPQQLITKLLNKEVGSVVIVDKKNQPIGIVTINDFLEAITKINPSFPNEKWLKVNTIFPKNFTYKTDLKNTLYALIESLNKVNPINNAKLVLEEQQKIKGKVQSYIAKLFLKFDSGEKRSVEIKATKWKKAINKTFKKIRNTKKA
jgi:CBS domain-containing protein